MTLPEVFGDEQVQHNQMRVVLGEGDRASPVTGSPLRLDHTPAIADTAAPDLGAHTSEVLRNLGASDDEIAELIDDGLAFQG